MHRAYAGWIERGERIDYLYALADALGLSPRDLFQPTRRFSRIARTASRLSPWRKLT
jgi:sulfite reductase beta subunit-like hemoprotein